MMRIKEIRSNHTEAQIYELFPWLKKAEIENAVVSVNENRLTWHDGAWKGGTWVDGDWLRGTWYDGAWHGGAWHRGAWHGGTSCIARNRWKIQRNNEHVTIGCNTKTISEWDEWFAGDEEYETPRNTPEFKQIHNAFLLAKYEYELEVR